MLTSHAVTENWTEIDAMVCELGELYALEAEAAAFPEVTNDPAIREIRLAVLRATDEMQRVARSPFQSAHLDRAREALAGARAQAGAARIVLLHARARRNRDH